MAPLLASSGSRRRSKKSLNKKILQNKARRTIMYVALKLWVRPVDRVHMELVQAGGTSFASAIAGFYSQFEELEETEFLGLRNSRSSCTYRGWELGVVSDTLSWREIGVDLWPGYESRERSRMLFDLHWRANTKISAGFGRIERIIICM